MKLRTGRDIEEAARQIVNMGARSVIIKGGHSKGPAVDVFFDGKQFAALKAQRVRTKNTHGTGCSFSAAIAAHLAQGDRMEHAVRRAKDLHHRGDRCRL